LVFCVAAYFGIRFLWDLAQARSSKPSAELQRAAITSVDGAKPSSFDWGGRELSDHEVVTSLLMTVDDVNAESGQLKALQILALDLTERSATLINLPVGMWVAGDEGKSTSADALYASSGVSTTAASRLTARVAAAIHQGFDHVLVMNEGTWNKFYQLASKDNPWVTEAGALLSELKCDMNANSLLEFAKQAHDSGITALTTADAEYKDWMDSHGTTYPWVQPIPLSEQLHIRVPAA
jgi:hypothetical protein